MNDTASLQDQIRATLSVPDSQGKLRARKQSADGTVVEHFFSWGTGLAHSRIRSRYISLYHEPPAWVEVLAPNKAARLYELAIENETALPETLPS